MNTAAWADFGVLPAKIGAKSRACKRVTALKPFHMP